MSTALRGPVNMIIAESVKNNSAEIFGYVIVGKTLTSTQIVNTERWMSYRTGVTL